MSRMLRKILCSLIVACCSVMVFAQSDHEPGVILIQVRDPSVTSISGTTVINGTHQLQNVLVNYGAITSRKLSAVGTETDGWYHVDFPAGANLSELQNEFLACQDIRYTTFNYYLQLSSTNDQYWDLQWALRKINIENAWNVATGGGTVLVGILDTGIMPNHPDLAANLWSNPNEIPNNGIDDDQNQYCDDIRGWNFYPATVNCVQPPPPAPPLLHGDNIAFYPQPASVPNSHGTRIAGVIAAKTNNGVGIAGIAGWGNVRLISLRVADGNFGYVNMEFAAEAILYLRNLRQQHGYTVITNMNFQSDRTDAQLRPFLNAVNAARNAGVIMIAAAGNCQTSPCSGLVDELPAPARWNGVLAIGASTDGTTFLDEHRSSYSLWSGGEGKLLCVAPVDQSEQLNVISTYPYDDQFSCYPYYYCLFNGTSAAAPIVVGVVALMLSVNPSLSYNTIRNYLAMTSEKIGGYNYAGNPSYAQEVGYGRTNAYKALSMANGEPNPPSLSLNIVYEQGLGYPIFPIMYLHLT